MPNNIDFKVTPTLNANNQKIEWKMCRVVSGQDQDCGSKNGEYPNVTLSKGQGAYVVQVRIDDPSNLGIKFASSPLNIKSGNPTGADSQITIPSGGGGTVLTFVDLNTLPSPTKPAPVTISYGLNFVDKNGKAVTDIDPDLTNGGTNIVEPGGGGGLWQGGQYSNYLLPAAIGLIAGIVLTLIVRRFLR